MSHSAEIVVTMGDPQGIGSEVIVKSFHHIPEDSKIKFRVFGWQAAFEASENFSSMLNRNDVQFVPLKSSAQTLGTLTPQQCGELACQALDGAVDYIRSHPQSALVTAPINKSNMQRAGFLFPGHTEFLCDAFGASRFAMMLFHSKLRVVLATIHVPLQDVSRLVTPDLIQEKLRLTEDALQRWFHIQAPRIAVCGLNPHAGENGLIGREELDVIAPAIQAFQIQSKSDVFGPLPADGVFHQALEGQYDAVLCMYHDQGLAPLKATGFYEGVNLTLGLPFLRVSPDHGTAFDIAGKNRAHPGSMLAAMRFAVEHLKQSS